MNLSVSTPKNADPEHYRPGHPIAPGYEVVSHMSRGDALDVYEVWSEERRCICVAKTIRPDRHEDRVRQRLLQEGHLLESLSHPHLVRAYTTITYPEPIIILETLTGPTLEDVIADRRRLDVPDIALLGIQLSSAIHYLHGKGHLHLDLNPSNIIAQCGTAKLIDLSLARPAGRMPHGLGTKEYLAPEQARGDEVGPATDIWGIGAVLYETAGGRAPFEARDDWESALLAAGEYLQLRRSPSPLRRRDLPSRLRDAIGQCLDPNPPGRPTSDQLAEVLGRFQPRSTAQP